MTTSNELQQQINDYETKLSELRKQQETERKGERLHAITAAKDLIKTHNLSAAELGLAGKTSTKRNATDKRNTVAPKYKDPGSEKTWTGRGKAPNWMSTQLAGGRNKQEFLISK